MSAIVFCWLLLLWITPDGIIADGPPPHPGAEGQHHSSITMDELLLPDDCDGLGVLRWDRSG